MQELSVCAEVVERCHQNCQEILRERCVVTTRLHLRYSYLLRLNARATLHDVEVGICQALTLSGVVQLYQVERGVKAWGRGRYQL